MIDRRNCDHCIFHDGHCRRWDCKYISRESAETLFEKSGLVCNIKFDEDKLKEICDRALEKIKDELIENIGKMRAEIENIDTYRYACVDDIEMIININQYRRNVQRIIDKYTEGSL